MAFDPWTASESEARAAADAWRDAGGDPIHRASPLFQWVTAQRVTAMRTEIEGADAASGFATLAALRDCLCHDLVAPGWLAVGFIRRYDAVLNCRADSWDDPQVFGRPYPKGKHLSALRKARLNRFALHNAVRQLLTLDPELGLGLAIKQAGKSLGLGNTLAETYYYEAQGFLQALSSSRHRIYKSGAPAKSAKFAGRVARRR